MKAISLKTLAVILSALSFFATSCDNDDDATPDKSKLLTGGSWQLTALTVDPAIDWFGTPVINVYSQLPTCVKDDLTIFKTDGKVNYDEGASKCEPEAPQTVTGAWTLNEDQTVLTTTRDGDTESWDISELKDNTFKVEYQTVEEGITYTFSATFVKK